MPLILYVLFAMTLMPIVLAWLGAYYRFKQFGRFDNHHPRIQQAQLTGTGARIQGAQLNAWESLIVFVAVLIIAVASGLDLNRLDTVAIVYLLCRLSHGGFYIANLAWLRSGVYALGMGCCLYLVYLSVQHSA